jgi:YidC/Oxa1 family membrane protein insertase
VISLDWIYLSISWILLSWHSVWQKLHVTSALGTNWAWILSIIFLVVTVRVVLFPVFVKQIKSQRAMQALQPKVKELQEKHKGDRETLQKEMMELYRREKANPLMGCLPMFLQIPVFLGLFHVLRRLNPDNNSKTLYGWTVDQFESATHAKLFTAPIAAKFGSTASELAALDANGTTVKIIAAILVLTMMVTTYMTTKQMINRTGRAVDPQQRMIQTLMLYGIPASLLVSGALFPIGVIIYWVTNNLFSLGQQQWVLRKYPPPAIAATGKAATGKGTTGTRTGAPKTTAAKKTTTKSGTAKKATKAGTDTQPVIDGKALAPRPGAKPVNPKKGGATKRKVG